MPTDVSVAESTTSHEVGKDLESQVDKDLRHCIDIRRKHPRES